MIKINYPEDPNKLDLLKINYLKLFDIQKMERNWGRRPLPPGKSISDILIGDFDSLVDVYYWYKNKNFSRRQQKNHSKIFDYKEMQPKIASFFMDKGNEFDLSTCHYCNMAYVNSYSKSMAYANLLDFINRASKAEFREFFDETKLSAEKLNGIITGRRHDSLEEFNSQRFLRRRIESYKCLNLDQNRNHFDIDHLLPKSICPIIGLSLFNFVPSCQVCNEKLKKDLEIAQDKEGWLKISPTNPSSSFDHDVTIKIVPQKSCSTFFSLQRIIGNYRLSFDTGADPDYDSFVSVLHLNDRYNYHKELALNILSLKERYTSKKRKEISRMLSAMDGNDKDCRYSEEQIEEDIFQQGLNHARCFAKLRRDMLDRN